MPRTLRQKCIECDKSFEAREMREVGDGLLRIYLAVRLSQVTLVATTRLTLD